MRLRLVRRTELPLESVALAKRLIGMTIVSDAPQGRAAARIVECEAYLPGDAAAHSFRGPTARNASLFLRRGHAYVYFIYGNHYCLNVSSDSEGIGAGVLLRAGEPCLGPELMSLRRNGAPARDLCRGPGRLAAALGVGRTHDGLDLCVRGELWLAAGSEPAPCIAASPRIGITRETSRLLRFYEAGNPYVSGPKRILGARR